MPSSVSIATASNIDPVFPIKAARPIAAGDLVCLKEHGKIEPASGSIVYDNSPQSTGLNVIGAAVNLNAQSSLQNARQFLSSKPSASSPGGKSIQLIGTTGGTGQYAGMIGIVYDPKTKVATQAIIEGINNSQNGCFSGAAWACPNGTVGAFFYDVRLAAGAVGSTLFYSSVGGRISINPTASIIGQQNSQFNAIGLSDNSVVLIYQKTDSLTYLQRFNSSTGAVLTAETLITNDTQVSAIAAIARKDGGFALLIGSSSTATGKGDRIYVYDAAITQTLNIPSTGVVVSQVPTSINISTPRETKYIGELSDGRLVFLKQGGFQVLNGAVLTQVNPTNAPWTYVAGSPTHNHLFINEDDEVHVIWGISEPTLTAQWAACLVDGTILVSGSTPFSGLTMANLSYTYHRFIAVHLGGRHYTVLRNDYDNSQPANSITICTISMDRTTTVGTSTILKNQGGGNYAGFIGLHRNLGDGAMMAAYTDASQITYLAQYLGISSSILGVSQDNVAAEKTASISTSGIKTFNQSYSGVLSFDRTLGTSLAGNKGIIAGNTISMKGV